MPYTFTALDFETADSDRNSICQVGIVRVVNSVITEKINTLVQPPNNFFNYYNTQVHGITSRHTYNASTFNIVWDSIKHLIENQTVVAHNASFDNGCLAKTLAYYNLPLPAYQQECTRKIYKGSLAVLCAQHKIALKHHDALSDALACATLYIMHLQNKEQKA